MSILPEVKISGRYKRISILVNKNNKVELRIPNKSFLKLAFEFLSKNEVSINRKLSENRERFNVLDKGKFSFVDRDKLILFDTYEIEIIVVNSLKKKYRFWPKKSILEINSDFEDKINDILSLFCRKIAKKLFVTEVNKVVKSLGITYNKIFIKDTESRWGSCSSNRNLNFNFRLILAPKNVFEYIVVHEVCHLVHMNHSKSYWNLVAKCMPEYKTAHNWLKENGFLLKMYFK